MGAGVHFCEAGESSVMRGDNANRSRNVPVQSGVKSTRRGLGLLPPAEKLNRAGKPESHPALPVREGTALKAKAVG